MVNDPISDMLTRIRNAQAVKKETVSIPYSKIKMELAEILVKEKFAKSVEHKGKKNKKTIDIALAYDESGNPAIIRAKRISKPSRRIYSPANKIMPVRHGFGMRVFSTPKGILTDKEARNQKVGGEILCEIY